MNIAEMVDEMVDTVELLSKDINQLEDERYHNAQELTQQLLDELLDIQNESE